MKRGLPAVTLFTTFLVVLSSVSIMSAEKRRTIRGGPPEKITMHPKFGTAESVSGRFTVGRGNGFAGKARAFVAARPETFKMNRPDEELELISETTDELGLTHVRFQQVYRGLPVWGKRTIVHFENERTIYRVGGQTIPTPKFSVVPAVDEVAADDLALAALKDRLPLNNTNSEIETLIYPNNGDPRLAQMVTVTSPDNGGIRWRVFVDAQTGEILHKFNDIHFDGPAVGTGPDTRDSLRTFNVYETTGVYRLIDATHNGYIYTYDNYYGGGPLSTDTDGDRVWDDNPDQKAEVAGHYYTQLTYDYFLNTFGRDSYDGMGSDIIVNVHDPLYVNNAYWNGTSLNFADGDGVNYLPFSGSLDIVAHELTHGVTEHSAGLIYQFMSGALNESYSDVFGAMVDRDDWYLGEEIGLVGNFIRSMENPNLKGHPMHMDEYLYYDIDTDNGGVHINSGIPNHAYYQAATLIGKDKAEQIWYRTLTTYLTPSSGFYFWAGMTVQSAVDLYGASSAEVDGVEAALAAVGLGTAYASSQLVETGALVGETASDEIWIHNPGTSTGSLSASVVPPVIDGMEVIPGTYYQENIPDGDSSQFIITYDASEFGACGVGSFTDTLVFQIDGPYGLTYIRLPMSVTSGLTSRVSESQVFSTPCLSTRTSNTAAMDLFSRGGNDVLYDASLMIGMIDGISYQVYRDLFDVRKFAPVDTIGLDAGSQSYRIATVDGRIQGAVTYSYDTENSANCDFIVIDYTLYNSCDTALNILTGLAADFDIDNAGANQVDFDESRNMIFMRNSADTRAVGMALLSGTARNLRGLYNPSLIYGGAFTDAVAYSEMFSSNNVSGNYSDDWSALLTFGDAVIGPGDTLQYRVAMLYSNNGSASIDDIADRAADWIASQGYTCGDVDNGGSVNLLDITYLINYLYKSGPSPAPFQAADVNNSGGVNLLDITYLINYLYKSGPLLICP